MNDRANRARVMTVGHSTRTAEELVAMLLAHGVERVVDVRRFPGSRRHPPFGREALAASLADAGFAYEWREELAGYADHMDTPEFRRGAEAVLERARSERLAILCAEARPEQCHRRLIADWLTAHGAEVFHLVSERRAPRHEMPAFARVSGGRVVYDRDASS